MDFKEYKNLYEIRNENIVQIKEAIKQVEIYISQKNRILYGGMAIHLALLKAGHKGLYSINILNDFDYYSDNPVNESLDLMEFLKLRFENSIDTEYKFNSINALHLTSRRIRLDITAVADISYYPSPYINNIPTMQHNGLSFVHPDYQRIDMHLSLSYLYAGAPQDNYKNRLNKDIQRLLLLNEYYPISKHKISPMDTKNYLLDFFKKSTDSMLTDTRINTKQINKLIQPDNPIIKNYAENYCFGGKAALYYIYKLMAKIDSQYISNIPALKIALKPWDILEVYSDAKICTQQGTKYERTYDILPEAVTFNVDLHYPVVIYQNYGSKLSATKTEYGWVANIHYLACTFLFKYFMLGEDYLEYYLCCWELMNLPEKFHSINSPISVNGTYFGSENISMPWLLGEKQESCRILGKQLMVRPAGNAKVNILDYISYKSTGYKTNEFLIKDIDCI